MLTQFRTNIMIFNHMQNMHDNIKKNHADQQMFPFVD